MALRHSRTVDENFFGARFHAFFFAAIERVVLACFEAGIVPIAVLFYRHTLIGFLDTTLHFFEEFFLKIIGMSEHRLCVSVLSIEIVEHIFRLLIALIFSGIFLLIGKTHPVVVVDTCVAVLSYFEGSFFGHRRLCSLLRNGRVTCCENKRGSYDCEDSAQGVMIGHCE